MRTLSLATMLGFGLGFSSGCVVKADDVAEDETGDTEAEGDGDGDGSTSEGDGDGDPSTGDGDGDGDPSTGDGDGDGDPSTGDGDGDGQCEPGDPSVDFSHEPFEFGEFGDGGAIDVDWTCTVANVDTSEGLDVELDCPEWPTPISIVVTATPLFLPPVEAGDTVQVRYLFEGPFWYNTYLRLDLVDHGHLLTLIDGDSLVPERFVFELPIGLTATSIDCAWIPSDCVSIERLALDVVANGEASQHLDGTHSLVGGIPGTDLWIEQAHHHHDVQCTDTPSEWFRVLIADTGQE